VRGGCEVLYVIYLLMPRFAQLSTPERVQTLFHELYHIAPEFNGDFRRFPGRNFAHGPSRKAFDASVAPLAQRWLQGGGALRHEILSVGPRTLERRYASVAGLRLTLPRLTALPHGASAETVAELRI
jgi:hypothetical protein